VEPRGLAFNSFGHLLVCVYSKKDKRSFVERYDKNMEKVQEIEHNGDKKLYEEPCFVCCNRNGDVCVADHGLNAIVVVDQFGVFQFSYRGQNVKSFRPYSLATDRLCNIVITDNANHEVHLLDKYGQFLGFLTTGPKIKRPGAVDIDEEGKVWIGESMSGKLHVLNYLVENMVKPDDISSMGRIN
uniref:Tripartite motif-containing protein 2 n=1 Tax=Magallana gigas TaxID=29159 RepID=A0A8W8KJN4_MAGGI